MIFCERINRTGEVSLTTEEKIWTW